MGEAEARAGKKADADARFQRLVDRMPRNRAVVLTYAQVLGERGDAGLGQEGAGHPARRWPRRPPTIRSTRRPSPARATWPAIPSAPAKPMPRPST